MNQTDHSYVDRGRTVLAVPVPSLQQWVRARAAHYDPAYLAADPEFGQAHVTLLAPWVRKPSAEDLSAVGEIVARARSFDYEFGEVETFPDGIIHLRVHPEEPFRALFAALYARFPQCLPYEGRHGGEVVPHVTLDALSGGVDEAWVRESVRPESLPAERATCVQLQWWQAEQCRVLASWPLPSE